MKKLKKITIVVPVYDEESNIEYFHKSLKKVISNENMKFYLLMMEVLIIPLMRLKKLGKKIKE